MSANTFARDWWRTGVIYQIYPRSFFAAQNKEIGDLAGITSKMSYLASLGIDAIWLSPFFKSPMKDYGYDVEDYCAVDPQFGTMQHFKDLLMTAHNAGLKVIIDQVYNHTSDRHPWFSESRANRHNPRADWYVWADPKEDGSPPNNWLAVFGGSAWQWDARREQYYLHQFLVEQPDLNFNNPAVQRAILDVAKFWLDLGVDGFRLDTVHCYLQDPELRDNPPAREPAFGAFKANPYFMQEHLHDIYYQHNLPFISKLRALVDQYDARMLVGEIGGDRQLDILCLYTQPERLHSAYTFGFLSEFDTSRFHEIFAYLKEHLKDGWPCWAFSNHDVQRIASRGQIADEHRPAYTRMMMTLLVLMRGLPCIYQGEELGLPEADLAYADLHDPFGLEFWPEYKGRDGCRTPMPWQRDLPNAGFADAKPWLPVPEQHLPLAVDQQEKDESSMLHFTRRLLKWRKQLGELLLGDMALIEMSRPILGFTRTQGDRRLFCLFNYSAKPTKVKIDFEGQQILLDASIDAQVKERAVHLGPYAACLLTNHNA